MWKISLFVRSEILGLFVNMLTTDDKYFRHIRENLPQLIQMQFYQKWVTFCQYVIAFLEST